VPLDPIAPELFSLDVERFYAGLIAAHSSSAQNSGAALGGKLLYVGELDAEARALLVAANIAGAASLSVAPDAARGKQALREGVVDFLVTTLDEALCILKNELRKRQTVAVCVTAEVESLEAEMRKRGVQPDLLRANVNAASEENSSVVVCRVASAPALWLPKIDAIAEACLGSEEGSARRWLHLSPRYLGRLAQGVRVLRSSESVATNFLKLLREEFESGKNGAPVEVKLICQGETVPYGFTPHTG